MKKYYIGLIVLALIVIGLVGFTFYQGSLAKQDKKTAKEVVRVADKLNNYVLTQNKVPASLSAVGIKNAPKEISYTKLPHDRYKFCATYKTALRGYAVSPTEVFYATLFRYQYGDQPIDSNSYEPSSLYVSEYYHDKGQNCQTVKPQLYHMNSEFCDPNYQYYSLWKDYCESNGASLDPQVN